MLITKQELKTYFQFSDKIEDRFIDFHIKKVQETIVQPLLAPAMFTNLLAIVGGSTAFPQLKDLLDDYIKAWMAYNVGYSFYAQHGVNATQYGLVVINEDTSTPLAPQDRANILATLKNDGNTYYLRLRKKMNDDSFTYDTIKYDDVCRAERGFNAVVGRVGKAVEYRSYDRLKDRWYDL